MSKPFDATMRSLLELDPAAWLRFLHIRISDPSRVKVIDSNISTITAEADKVLWIDEPEPWIEHVELQASRDRGLPERAHWYSTLMSYGHSVPVHSTIILLRQAADGPELNGTFEQTYRRGDVYVTFRYDVVRIWDQPVEEILNAGLPVLPLATVANVGVERVPEILVAISNRLTREASTDQAATLWNATRILMGLRYSESQVDQIIERISAMLFGIHGIEESSVYQGILRRGEVKGRAEGEVKGRAEGKVEGRAEGEVKGRLEAARGFLLRLGRKKFGPPPERLEAKLAAIEDFDRLTELSDRILDASSWDELMPPEGGSSR